METVFEFLKIFNLDDFLSSENKTRGGDKDKDEKELIVFPYKIEFFLVVSTVIPVANVDCVFLKFFISIWYFAFCVTVRAMKLLVL